MINKPLNIDDVFRPLFNEIPQYHLSTGNLSDKIFYHLGDQEELNEVLITKQHNGSKAYPLLWYNLPNTFQENDLYANGDFDFVLAVNTSLDEFNDQRFNFSFKEKLYPNLNLLIQTFRGAQNVTLNRLSGGSKMYWERTEYPNYGNATKESEDYWDALKVKVNLTISKGNCQGKIKYNTENLV